MTQLTAKSTSSEITFNHSTTSLDSFAPRLLDWFAKNGRHDLPWQQHNSVTGFSITLEIPAVKEVKEIIIAEEKKKAREKGKHLRRLKTRKNRK